MRMRRVTAIAAAAVISLGVSLAVAQPGGNGGRGPGGFMAGRMARLLNLSDDQKAAFQKALDAQRPQFQALHQQLRDNRSKLQELLQGESPDPAAVGQLVIQGHALMTQAKALRDQSNQTLRGLLTPDQQAKFDALQSLRQGGFGPMGGPGGFGQFGHGRWGRGQGAQPPPPQEQ